MAGPPVIWNGTNAKFINSASVLVNPGTVSAPSVAFRDNTGTGVYESATNEVAISNNGTFNTKFKADGTRVWHTTTSGNDYTVSTASGVLAIYPGAGSWSAFSAYENYASNTFGTDSANTAYYWPLHVSLLNTGTDPSAIIPHNGNVNAWPVLGLTNRTNTIGSFSSLAFQGSTSLTDQSSVIAQVVGVLDDATASAQSGHLELWVRNAGTTSKRLNLAKDGTLTLGAYGAGALLSSSSGVVSSQAMTNGQLLIGSTGSAPSAATLTAGAGISVSNGAGTITLSTSGNAAPNVLTTTQNVTLNANNDYVLEGGNKTVTLPDCTTLGSNKVWFIKNTCSTCTVTVQMGGSNTYEDGTTSVVLSDPFVAQEFLCNQGSVIYGF